MDELTKACTRCGKEKLVDEFNKQTASVNGFRSECRKCQSEYGKKYRERNPEKKKKRDEEYRKNNVRKIKETRKKYQRKRENKNKMNECQKLYYQRHKKDPILKLNQSVSAGMRYSLRNSKNGNHWELLVGYTIIDLIKHLESQFQENMSWKNYGKWHIDHIIPISLFNIISIKCKGFKKCWSLENLRPLWAFENVSKSNKLFH